MRRSHEILLKFRFDPRYSFTQVQVWYVDRGAPGNHSCVDGDHISTLDSYYMEIEKELETKCIPYHRIRKILYMGKVVWER